MRGQIEGEFPSLTNSLRFSMKVFLSLFLLLLVVGTPTADAAPQKYRVMYGDVDGIGLAWGFKDELTDFEALRASGQGFDYSKTASLENYLVDLGTGKILVTMPNHNGTAVTDFHPGQTWYSYFGVQSFGLFPGQLYEEKDDRDNPLHVKNVLDLKLEGNINYHHESEGILTEMFLLAIPGYNSNFERKVIASCPDCEEQFERELKSKVSPEVFAQYKDVYFMHHFKFDSRDNEMGEGQDPKVTLPFQLHATSCWQDPGSFDAAGEMAVTRDGDRLKLSFLNFKVGMVVKGSCGK